MNIELFETIADVIEIIAGIMFVSLLGACLLAPLCIIYYNG